MFRATLSRKSFGLFGAAFMLAVTLVEGAITLSTTGSLDSDFVGYGWDLIRKMDRSEYDNFALFLSRHPGMTHIFEAVHPDDPHIIPEVEGLYYLGSRYHNTESGIVNIAAADPGGSGFALAKSGIFVLQPEKTPYCAWSFHMGFGNSVIIDSTKRGKQMNAAQYVEQNLNMEMGEFYRSGVAAGFTVAELRAAVLARAIRVNEAMNGKKVRISQ